MSAKILLEMLSYKRPHTGRMVRTFNARYLATLPGAFEDSFHNWHVPVGPESAHRILFSSHTDTVHDRDGRQRVYCDPSSHIITLHKKERRPDCLGADCTVGVYIMREMILAGVPGWYVFHHGEEAGCIGSQDLAMFAPETLAGVDCAIAFDRRGQDSVITHQCGRRTASAAFAQSLADALNAADPTFAFKPDSTGLFTDTDAYADQVSECTNLSVGYESAHGSRESVDLRFVLRMRAAVLALDWQALRATRDPAVKDRLSWPRKADTPPKAAIKRSHGYALIEGVSYRIVDGELLPDDVDMPDLSFGDPSLCPGCGWTHRLCGCETAASDRSMRMSARDYLNPDLYEIQEAAEREAATDADVARRLLAKPTYD